MRGVSEERTNLYQLAATAMLAIKSYICMCTAAYLGENVVREKEYLSAMMEAVTRSEGMR